LSSRAEAELRFPLRVLAAEPTAEISRATSYALVAFLETLKPGAPMRRPVYLIRVLKAFAFAFIALTLGAEPEKTMKDIPWVRGPVTGDLIKQAEIKVPEGYLYTGAAGTKSFLEMTENFPNGREAGMYMPIPDRENPKNGYFVIFEYADVGYVKDDEKGKINADELLESLKKGTEEANVARRERGWPPMHVIAWSKAPFYDPKTNNLTWGTLIRVEKGGDVINYTTRMLGRQGFMKVDLVCDPETFTSAIADYEKIMKNFEYTQGNRYAEFKKGDKVAAIGLTALVAGGAGALLVKSGLLAKFWKLLIPVFIGIAAVFQKMWGAITGKKKKESLVLGNPEDSKVDEA